MTTRDKCKKGLLWIVTREKFVQAGITSMMFGIISAATEGLGIVIVSTFTLSIPAKWTMVPFLFVLLLVFLWADNNLEEYRDTVEQITRQDVNDDGTVGE